MMTDTVVLVLLLVLLAIFSRYLKRRKMIRGLATFPGPTAYPLIGNTIDLIRFKFSMTRAVDYWTKRYGDIYCIWLGSVPTVILSKPQDLEILLSSTKHIDKSELYSLIYPWIGRGLLTSSGKKWHSRRKLITPTFHFRILDQFVEVFNRNSDILVKKLLETEGKEKVDIHAFITLCTLDIICETAMGTKVHAQNDTVSSYVKAVHNSLVTLHERSMKPWLTPDAIFYLLSSGRQFKKSLKVLHDYTREVIKTRQRDREAREACQTDSSTPIDEDIGIKRRKAFLDQLLDVKDSSNAELTDQDIQEEVDTFMFEGHDTTAAALSFILYNVAAHSEVQEKLVKEMDEIFGDSDRAATTQDIQNMKYSELVVKETLRMYPSVPLFARSLKADLAVTDGYVIPAGSNVGVSCLQMGYNSKHWPEPEKFDPERHLPENSTRRHPFAFVPFSAGPRNCIGQKYAMMEMKATLSKIVRHCELDVPFAGYKPEVEGQIILKAPKGVLLIISRRKPASEASA